MPLDTAQWVGEWDTISANNQPQGSDTRREGDNQIRDAKKVIKDSLPNILGAVTPTHTQLNTLSDISTSQTVETRLTTLEDESARFVTGTTIVFYQATLPVGYSQVTENDCLMRVVTVASGLGGNGINGLHNPVIMDKVPPHNHSFTTGSAGDHVHDLARDLGVGGTTGLQSSIFLAGRQITTASGYVYSAGAHTHTGSTQNNTGADAVDWQPRFINIILGRKN